MPEPQIPTFFMTILPIRYSARLTMGPTIATIAMLQEGYFSVIVTELTVTVRLGFPPRPSSVGA